MSVRIPLHIDVAPSVVYTFLPPYYMCRYKRSFSLSPPFPKPHTHIYTHVHAQSFPPPPPFPTLIPPYQGPPHPFPPPTPPSPLTPSVATSPTPTPLLLVHPRICLQPLLPSKALSDGRKPGEVEEERGEIWRRGEGGGDGARRRIDSHHLDPSWARVRAWPTGAYVKAYVCVSISVYGNIPYT